VNKDIGKFAESLVRDTVGSLTGLAQEEQAFRERTTEKRNQARTAVYSKFDPAAIKRFAEMGSELTGMTRAELEAAKPVAMSEKAMLANPSAAKSREAEYASMTASQRERIQGLYKGSQARLGAIERGRLRPGRKQTVLTKRM
jgi:hypothetical protein